MDQRLTDGRVIEFFHLAFLQVLQARLDQARYVVKGGANLRYFFESLRYSEDIDLDAVAIEPWKLEAKVDEVLASPATGLLLRSGGLAVEQVTKPKQTATTQRWKPLIAVSGRRVPVRTKIEFSHRATDPRRILEAVPDRVVAPYALRAPTMLHYTADAAIEQKIGALAQRSETQARDVFDLELLLRRHRDAIGVGEIEPHTLEVALERAFELPFEAFRDQVVRFLDPEVAELYDDHAAWERMQAFVAERLMELR
ncbi:MAG: nucleotidyl transferase AbiEii/AbiGii toxin family protein [Actinomycetota bacterium]